MKYADHFSEVAGEYARHRPGYPDRLFRYLASLCARREQAWDCATGSGQAAVGLAAHFRRVVATDASASQVQRARLHPRIRYEVRPVESSGLGEGSTDLVTAAQALHWFAGEPFYREVDRVLRPGGVLAAWCYQRTRISPEVDRVMDRFHDETVGPCWPFQRAHVDAAYRSIPFPWPAIETPAFEIRRELDLDAFLAYLATWSAVREFIRRRGANPLEELYGELAEAWGGGSARTVIWPLALRAGRKPARD